MMQALMVFVVYLVAHSLVMVLAFSLQAMLLVLARLGPWLAWLDAMNLGWSWWAWLGLEALLMALWAGVRHRSDSDIWAWLRS